MGNDFILQESRSRVDIRKKFFAVEVVKTLEQAAQRGDGCPIPGNIPSQVGWSAEQPGLLEDVPAHCRGVGLDRFISTQTIL